MVVATIKALLYMCAATCKSVSESGIVPLLSKLSVSSESIYLETAGWATLVNLKLWILSQKRRLYAARKCHGQSFETKKSVLAGHYNSAFSTKP